MAFDHPVHRRPVAFEQSSDVGEGLTRLSLDPASDELVVGIEPDRAGQLQHRPDPDRLGERQGHVRRGHGNRKEFDVVHGQTTALGQIFVGLGFEFGLRAIRLECGERGLLGQSFAVQWV